MVDSKFREILLGYTEDYKALSSRCSGRLGTRVSFATFPCFPSRASNGHQDHDQDLASTKQLQRQRGSEEERPHPESDD